jgi:HEPN domain-containing protein
MTDQSAALVAEWYRYAAEDLAAAEAWQAQPPAVPRHVCNMAQQSAEKALKACLIVAGIDFPKTHDLEQLRGLLPDVWPLKATLPQLAWLTDWAVDARSPSDVGEASDGDARRAVDEARQVWDAVSHELTGRNVQPPS